MSEFSATVKVFEKDNLKGFASLTIDKCFIVTDLKIMSGQNGLFVSFPSKKIGDDWKDTCFPITKDAREQIIKVVLDAYEKANNSTVANNATTQTSNPWDNDDEVGF